MNQADALIESVDSSPRKNNETSKKAFLRREKYLQVSNYVTTWNQTVQHKFLIDCWGLLFLLAFFFSTLNEQFFTSLTKPLPYHIAPCLRKKSKTQNMGQIYIFTSSLRRVNEIWARKQRQEESRNLYNQLHLLFLEKWEEIFEPTRPPKNIVGRRRKERRQIRK